MLQEEGAERASRNVLLSVRRSARRYIEEEIARILTAPRELSHDVLAGRTRGERLCLRVREGAKGKNRTERRGRLGDLSNHYSLFELQVDCTAKLGLKRKGITEEWRRAHLEEKEIRLGMGMNEAVWMSQTGPRPRI